MHTEAKRKTLICPGCGARLLKVAECSDLTLECFSCGSYVTASISREGEMAIDYKPCYREEICLSGHKK